MEVRKDQHGGSIIGLVIILAFLGYAVFVAIQYVPQYIESTTMDTVLQSIEDAHRKEPLTDIRSVQAAVDKQLYINGRTDMENHFSIVPIRGSYVVTVRYQRDLDLLFTKKQLEHGKSVTLD
jgi:hypothetical protein